MSHLLYQELLQVGHLLADLLLELLFNVLVASTTPAFTCPHFSGSLVRFVEKCLLLYLRFFCAGLNLSFQAKTLLCVSA